MKHRPILAGDTIPQSFLDALQELVATLSANFVLRQVSDTQLRAPAGSGNAQVAMSIMGKWRWITADVTVTMPGAAAGTYPIYVTAADNVFTGTGVSEVDATNYAFGLEIRTSGTPSTDLWRQVGTATWNGSKITTFEQTVGQISLAAGSVTTVVLADGSVTTPKLAPDVALVPVGGVLEWPWASGSIPAWALLPYGQSLSASGYPAMQALAEASGLPFGGTAGSSFTMPDMRGRVSAGKDNMGGSPAGRFTVAVTGSDGTALGGVGGAFGGEGVLLTTSHLPAHNHMPFTGQIALAGTGITGAGGGAGNVDYAATGLYSSDGGAGTTYSAVSGDTITDGAGAHHHEVQHARTPGAGESGGGTFGDGYHSNGDATDRWRGQIVVSNPVGIAYHPITDDQGGHNHTVNSPGHRHSFSDPTHYHTFSDPTHRHGLGDLALSSVGGGVAHSVVQPTIVVNKLMRVL